MYISKQDSGDDPILIGSNLINDIIGYHNITQVQLAKILGLTPQYLCRIYNGKSKAGSTLINLLKLVNRFPMSVVLLDERKI